MTPNAPTTNPELAPQDLERGPDQAPAGQEKGPNILPKLTEAGGENGFLAGSAVLSLATPETITTAADNTSPLGMDNSTVPCSECSGVAPAGSPCCTACDTHNFSLAA